METTTYPKGTTKEQWDRYEAELASHKEYIERYKWFLHIICNRLYSRRKNLWTIEEIREAITSEISMSDSCDAPNKPGYYRANND